jgi:hypothetical protein
MERELQTITEADVGEMPAGVFTPQVQEESKQIPDVVSIVEESKVVEEDRYPDSTHADNSLIMYGVPFHEAVGAMAYGKSKDPDKYTNGFTKSEVAALIPEFLSQEHQGEKQLFELRNA